MIIQLIAAFAGSIGFAILFNMKGKQILFAGIGGALTWLIYLIFHNILEDYFVSYLIAAVFVAIYAEVMARVNRAPSTIFLTATAIPLIPGGSLYYTMYGLVIKDGEMFITNGQDAIIIALAIALGFVFVAVVTKYVNKLVFSVDKKGCMR